MSSIEETAENIVELTNKKMSAWSDHEGYAPPEASVKLNKMMSNWIISLTETLRIWAKKGTCMTDGELILACTNIGSLVECMMKFVLCVYVLDYERNPVLNSNGKVIQPEKLMLDKLKDYCFKNVWDPSLTTLHAPLYTDMALWVDSIQHKRNAIHAFNKKEIGDAFDFQEDIENYWKFLKMVCDTLPDDPCYDC